MVNHNEKPQRLGEYFWNIFQASWFCESDSLGGLAWISAEASIDPEKMAQIQHQIPDPPLLTPDSMGLKNSLADYLMTLYKVGPLPVITGFITPITRPFIRPFIGVITPFITARGPPCMIFEGFF